MTRYAAIFLALAPVAAAAQSPTPSAIETRGLWLDWRGANQASLAAEARRQADQRRTVADARSLGDRVGQLVASGDCDGGERMAREAGDFPLVDAVREYCRNRPVARP